MWGVLNTYADLKELPKHNGKVVVECVSYTMISCKRRPLEEEQMLWLVCLFVQF